MPRRNVYLPKDLDDFVTENNIQLAPLLQETLRELMLGLTKLPGVDWDVPKRKRVIPRVALPTMTADEVGEGFQKRIRGES